MAHLDSDCLVPPRILDQETEDWEPADRCPDSGFRPGASSSAYLAPARASPPMSVPDFSGSDAAQKAALRSALAEKIRAIERRPIRLAPVAAANSDGEAKSEHPEDTPADPSAWSFGLPAIDARLPPGALDRAGVHEVKPQSYGDVPAAFGLALRLAVRHRLGLEAARLQPQSSLQPGSAGDALLWCMPMTALAEWGRPYGPGLAGLGLDPDDLLLVTPRRQADVLWAIEEALRSGGIGLVVGIVDDLDLTAARRLSLAAAETRTPALLLTRPGGSGIGATATRWRVARRPGGPHPFVESAPGPLRLALRLERCRTRAPACDDHWLNVEWCDDTHRFRMAAPLADRAPDADRARRSA